MYRQLVRPLLFCLSPERAHKFSVGALKIVTRIPLLRNVFRYKVNQLPQLAVNKNGLRLPNPVGLAAGFDKNAEFFVQMAGLGFGFVEVGTVTPLPQPGNPPPRLFRLPADNALINRMGFNNQGVDRMARRLAKKPDSLVIGGNIGKNKNTPNEDALSDYLKCFRALAPYIDYLAINVSSPNTPGLRALQEKEPLMVLITGIKAEAVKLGFTKPILLKISPDLTDEDLVDIAEIVRTTNLNGLIATNTTLDRSSLKTPMQKVEAIGAGGLSGKPLRDRSTEVIRKLRKLLGEKPVIIGVGGIHSAEDALMKLDAGADAVQLYTGFIYEGPSLIADINQAILNRKLNSPAKS